MPILGRMGTMAFILLKKGFKVFIIIITSNSCDPYHVGKVYKTEKEAEKGLKEYQRNWDSSDFYHLEGNIIKFKG